LTSDGGGAVAGVARHAADPDGPRAEFAVLARSDLKGHRIGRPPADRLVPYAKSRGLRSFSDM